MVDRILWKQTCKKIVCIYSKTKINHIYDKKLLKIMLKNLQYISILLIVEESISRHVKNSK